MDDDLDARRRAASAASGGYSDSAIYEMVRKAIHDCGAIDNVLDFGAGQGYFAGVLLESGLFRRVVAADLIARPTGLSEAIEWLQADLNRGIPSADSQFDIVTAVEVIEHLENPRAMMRERFRILRPGGTLLLTTPNNESIRSLISLAIRGHFAAFGPDSYPAHVTALLAADLVRASREAGFVDQAVSYSGTGMVPGMPGRTWQGIGLGVLCGKRFSDNLLLSCRRPN